MTKVRTLVGLDVHAAKAVACVVDAESGATGFALARALLTAGVGCVIAAPGKIERPARDKVKTDQRDAERRCAF